MKIAFIAAEMSPYAKVGGLADVVGSLPKALIALGHEVRVFLPHYRMLNAPLGLPENGETIHFPVEMNPFWSKDASLTHSHVNEIPVCLIGGDESFDRAESSSTLYQPGGDQHLFFSAACLAGMQRSGWIPDVIHCHDWHTGFVPVLMREKDPATWDDVSAVFTIHNFAYQGDFGIEVLDMLGLPRSLFNANQVEAWGRVNFLKSGCVFSDRVNTVSQSYAKEIQTPEFGWKLEGLMRKLADEGRLDGILNGIDQDFFNPSTDPAIARHFSLSDPSGKAECKSALLKEVGLPLGDEPLFGVVSRLSEQKGLDLLDECAEALAEIPAKLIVQGLGDPVIADEFRCWESLHPNRIRLISEFNPDLAQRVYAGSDMFLMPSRFEPCGLGQMIAMRYGTIPVVRATGGLKDTVKEGVTGFTFQHSSPFELLQAIQRACNVYEDKAKWNVMIQNAMGEDFGWSASAKQYVSFYRKAMAGTEARTA